MHELSGERVLMRIHITENDRYENDALSDRILGLIREGGYAGATIFRGSMSFGAHSRMHSDRLEVSSLDLPLVIECVETEENIRKILPDIDKMIGGGLITLESSNVVLYRSDNQTPETPHAARNE
jgi:uncharacterized protein